MTHLAALHFVAIYFKAVWADFSGLNPKDLGSNPNSYIGSRIIYSTVSTNLSEKDGIPSGLLDFPSAFRMCTRLVGFHQYSPARTWFIIFLIFSALVRSIVSSRLTDGVVEPRFLAIF